MVQSFTKNFDILSDFPYTTDYIHWSLLRNPSVHKRDELFIAFLAVHTGCSCKEKSYF